MHLRCGSCDCPSTKTFRSSEFCIIYWIFFILALGFGISVIVLFDQGKAYTSRSEDCPVILEPNPAPYPHLYSSREQILDSIWNWKYRLNDPLSGEIRQVCLSLTHDAELRTGGGHLIARTDGQVWSTISKTYIRDCHGDIVYVLRTGDVFQTLVNGVWIDVSFELRDASQTTVLAYVAGRSFLTESFDLIDARTGVVTASMARNLIDIVVEWHYIIRTNATEPWLMFILSGRHSFWQEGRKDNGQKMDTCNQYVYITGLCVLIVTCILFSLAVTAVVYQWYGWQINEPYCCGGR